MNHFAKLYLDEDVSVILAKVLSGRGFDVLTAKDTDMLRKSHVEQLLFGTKHSRAVLTHNRRHFERLHSDFVQKQLKHSGIVIAGRRDVYEMARRVARHSRHYVSFRTISPTPTGGALRARK